MFTKLVEKIGMDKVAHFGIGGLITALFTIILIVQDLPLILLIPWKVMLYPIVGSVITAFVSAIKELILDSKTDWKDLYAALIGSATVFVATIIGFLFFLGSN